MIHRHSLAPQLLQFTMMVSTVLYASLSLAQGGVVAEVWASKTSAMTPAEKVTFAKNIAAYEKAYSGAERAQWINKRKITIENAPIFKLLADDLLLKKVLLDSQKEAFSTVVAKEQATAMLKNEALSEKLSAKVLDGATSRAMVELIERVYFLGAETAGDLAKKGVQAAVPARVRGLVEAAKSAVDSYESQLKEFKDLLASDGGFEALTGKTLEDATLLNLELAHDAATISNWETQVIPSIILTDAEAVANGEAYLQRQLAKLASGALDDTTASVEARQFAMFAAKAMARRNVNLTVGDERWGESRTAAQSAIFSEMQSSIGYEAAKHIWCICAGMKSILTLTLIVRC